MVKSELHFTLEEIREMEWDTFYYWHRRAMELFNAKRTRPFLEIAEEEDGKVDSDVFQKRLERMNKKIAEYEKRKEGIISG